MLSYGLFRWQQIDPILFHTLGSRNSVSLRILSEVGVDFTFEMNSFSDEL